MDGLVLEWQYFLMHYAWLSLMDQVEDDGLELMRIIMSRVKEERRGQEIMGQIAHQKKESKVK